MTRAFRRASRRFVQTTDVAVLLVAGVGQRLRPLTDDRPKALVDVGGETILGRATRLLLAAGVRELVLATGYREDAVRAAMSSCPVPVTFVRNDAFDRTQNAVSLFLCREAVSKYLDRDIEIRGFNRSDDCQLRVVATRIRLRLAGFGDVREAPISGALSNVER